MSTMRLRCMRCGDWADMDPFEIYGWGLCGRCWGRHPDIGLPDDKDFAHAFHRWHERYQKCIPDHPTFLALGAAMEEPDPLLGSEAPW